MICRKDKEEEEKQQVDLEESTSGKRRSNKWKEQEQQVEKGCTTSGERYHNRWKYKNRNKWVLPDIESSI